MREPEEKVTVVNADGGGGSGAGVIAGIAIAIAAIVVVVLLFGGNIFTGQDRNVDVTIETPDISVEAPQAETPAAD